MNTADGKGRAPLTRVVSSLVAALFPVLALVWAWTAFAGRLPADMPIHWEGGKSDAVVPAMSLANGTMTGALLGVGVALIGYVFVRQDLIVRRVFVAIGGSISAVASAMWISAAWSVLDRADAIGAPMGAWVLLTLFGIAYGVLPALLLTSRSEGKRSTD